jgi:DNA-binding transcriptional MerR regulator
MTTVEAGAGGRSVGAVARLAGVTVRTLHHYDEIGLLRPSGRTGAGYRLYADVDLERLERILLYRELGFTLEDIDDLLRDGPTGALDHLRRQRRLLLDRIARLERMAAAVEKQMEAHEMGIRLTPEERFDVFGDFDPVAHADEVTERWGDTDAYAESARRTASYTKADWAAMKIESEAVNGRLIDALQAGLPADGTEAMDAAEAHRGHISRWFYECSPEMHVGLAEMYVADPRFTKTYEDLAPGLAGYIHDAIVANAARKKA